MAMTVHQTTILIYIQYIKEPCTHIDIIYEKMPILHCERTQDLQIFSLVRTLTIKPYYYQPNGSLRA